MREPIHESAPEPDWERLRPVLDQVMHELKETDREAILLRYFENRPFAEIGGRFALNENAARMRVERALEKLRAAFLHRGITATATLASVISANAVQIAPAGLAATLTTASLAGAGAGTGAFALLKFMNATQVKLGVTALVVAGATTALVVQHQTQTRLHAENAALTQQVAQLQSDNESLSNRLTAIGGSKSLSDDQLNELLRLRNEVTQLRPQQNVSPAMAQSETNSLPAVKKITIHLRTKFASLPMEDLQPLGVGWMSDAQGGKTGLLSEQQLKVINEALQGASDANVISAPQVITINGERATMSVTRSVPVDGTNVNTGEILEVTPFFSTNSSTFDLNLNARLIQLAGDSSQPSLQAIQMTNHVSLHPGQTVVLEKEIPPGGWLDSPANATVESRSLLMFVTPQVVDSDFMKPLHQQSRPPNPLPPNQ